MKRHEYTLQTVIKWESNICNDENEGELDLEDLNFTQEDLDNMEKEDIEDLISLNVREHALEFLDTGWELS